MTRSITNSIPAWIVGIQTELNLLNQTWRMLGAEGILIAQDNEVLYAIPDGFTVCDQTPILKAPMRLARGIFLLCVVGLNDVQFQSRLYADAQLITALIDREQHLDDVVNQAVSFQDQLLALSDLNQSLSTLTELQHILHVIAKQTQFLTNTECVFAMVFSDQSLPDVAQVGDSLGISLSDMITWQNEIANIGTYRLIPLELSQLAQVLAMPLMVDNKIMGVLGVVNVGGTFLMPEIKLVQALAGQGGIHIQKSILYQQHISQERMATEMALAREVQMQLLPQNPAQIQGLDVWGHSKPALDVGGDFYDFDLEEQTLRFALGDVAGKGMSAALLMATSRTALRVLDEETPDMVLSYFSKHLYDDFTHSNSFVTLFVGHYDTDLHILQYANAGHAPVIYCPAEGEPIMLEADCPPIGVLPDVTASTHLMYLAPNDVLVVASDGLPEAQHQNGYMLGYENMMALIKLYQDRSAQEIGELLLQAANAYQLPSDDQTIVVIKRVEE